jgi:hypothetical protein
MPISISRERQLRAGDIAARSVSVMLTPTVWLADSDLAGYRGACATVRLCTSPSDFLLNHDTLRPFVWTCGGRHWSVGSKLVACRSASAGPRAGLGASLRAPPFTPESTRIRSPKIRAP